MAEWSDLSVGMDQAVDAVLGDTLSVSFNAGSTWADIQGFVNPFSQNVGIAGIDEPLGSRPRVKILRSVFAGGEPDRNVRIRHARLGAETFRPAGGEPEEQGRYILFDVQKV